MDTPARKLNQSEPAPFAGILLSPEKYDSYREQVAAYINAQKDIKDAQAEAESSSDSVVWAGGGFLIGLCAGLLLVHK